MGDAIYSENPAEDLGRGPAKPSPETPLRRARNAQDAGDLEQAQRLYREAVSAEPGLVVAWKGLTRVAAARGDWAEAIDAGFTSLQLDPEEQKLHLMLPQILSQAGVKPKIRKRYDVLAWPSAPPKAYLSIATMHLDAGDRHRGRAWLERHFAAGLEPGPDVAADLRMLAADPDPERAVFSAVAPPLDRKWMASPGFFTRFADAGRYDLVNTLPRPPEGPKVRWVFPVYFGSTLPLNPKSRKDRAGFLLDRIPDVLKAVRLGRAVLLLDHGHEALFANHDARPRIDLLAFAAYLKAKKIPASRVLILDGNTRSPRLVEAGFRAAGLQGPRVLADRFLWLQAAGMFRQIAEAEGGAEARLARAEAALDRPRDKIFLSFNHAPRPHRAALLGFLLEKGLLDRGLVSYRGPDYTLERAGRAMEDAAWIDFTAGVVEPLVALERPGETIAELLRRAPLTVDVDYGPDSPPKTMAARANEVWPYEASYFSIVTETAFSDGRSSHVTEKVVKPIGNLHPFLYVGEPGVLAELRAKGFKTFAPMIDERYDAIHDPAARMKALLGEVERLASMTPEELDAFQRACWPAVRHNYQHLLDLAPVEAERIARRIGVAVDEALDDSWRGVWRRRWRWLLVRLAALSPRR
jgi:hypothetical protein